MMKTINVTEFEKYWLPHTYNYKYLNTDLNYLKYCTVALYNYWEVKHADACMQFATIL